MTREEHRASLHWRPQRCADVRLVNLDDEIVVYHPDRMTALALNATAASIWELCDGERTLLEIIDLLRRRYPDAAPGMEREVEDSVLTLLDRGVLLAPRAGPSASAHALELGGTTVRLEADDHASARILDFLCADMAATSPGAASVTFRLGPATRTGATAAYRDDLLLYRNRSEGLVAAVLLERVLDCLIQRCDSGMLLHAAAVARDGRALVLAGKTGAGKTTLATWLLHRGFDYLTEELVRFDSDARSLQGFARPLHVKEAARHLFDATIDMDGAAVMKAPMGYQISPRGLGARTAARARPAVLVFPAYRADARFDLRPLSKAQAATRLMACLVNARQHLPNGFNDVARLVRDVPAFAMTYADAQRAAARLESLLGND